MPPQGTPPTNYPPDTTALWGRAIMCEVVCVGASVYACVFVCLCGMAGQRNALAHAWLSRHNGPALSHCREIPLWYGGREREKEKEMRKPTVQMSKKQHSFMQNCGLLLFLCFQFVSTFFSPLSLWTDYSTYHPVDTHTLPLAQAWPIRFSRAACLVSCGSYVHIEGWVVFVFFLMCVFRNLSG